MALITVNDVQRVIGVSDDQLTAAGITDADILEHIYDAEGWIQRYCLTAFLDDAVSTVSVASSTANEITLTGVTWTANLYKDYLIYVESGTGSNQWKKISSNTTSAAVVDSNWDTQLDNTSKINVVYTPYTVSKDNKVNPKAVITIDGTSTNTLFLPDYPLLKLDSLTINSTSVTPSNVYQYLNQGKLMLKTTAEQTIFDRSQPQLIDITYWYGVYPTPRIIKRAIANYAGFAALVQLIGGTFDDVTSFTLPEMSGSLGEPYINIREVALQLKRQLDAMLPQLPMYYKFG